MHRLLLNEPILLYAPPEVLSPEGSTKIPSPKTADDINDLFKTIDDEKVVPDKIKEKVISEEDKEDKEVREKEEDDELELIEPEEDDEEIEKLNIEERNEEIETPPRKREILKKYPDVFKDFPFLEKMMYRDKQITEMFGSFDDAKEVAEKSETFNSFESQLLSGNTEEILRSVKETDEKAFNIIIDDYLPTLAKVDKEAYFHVIGNLNKRLIMEMVAEANDLENTDPDRAADLKQAALMVNQYVFGNTKFTPPTTRVPKKSPDEQSESEKERLSWVQERFESSRDDLQTRVDNTLKATISDYIDPKNVMSGYVKKNAVADAMKILTSAIASDPSVSKNLNRLWKSAFESKFSRDSLGRIQSFYLSKAKGNLKNAILKARAEALKDLAPKIREKEVDDEETPRRQRNITPGRPSQPQNKNGMKKGESVTDFFMRD